MTHQEMDELVNSLEAQRCIERKSNPRDRRARPVSFAPPCRGTMGVTLPVPADIQAIRT
jgi:hypothetical protein